MISKKREGFTSMAPSLIYHATLRRALFKNEA